MKCFDTYCDTWFLWCRLVQKNNFTAVIPVGLISKNNSLNFVWFSKLQHSFKVAARSWIISKLMHIDGYVLNSISCQKLFFISNEANHILEYNWLANPKKLCVDLWICGFRRYKPGNPGLLIQQAGPASPPQPCSKSKYWTHSWGHYRRNFGICHHCICHYAVW